jgi:hypothetical protein
VLEATAVSDTTNPSPAIVELVPGAIAGSFFFVGLGSQDTSIRPDDVSGGVLHVLIDMFAYVQ